METVIETASPETTLELAAFVERTTPEVLVDEAPITIGEPGVLIASPGDFFVEWQLETR